MGKAPLLDAIAQNGVNFFTFSTGKRRGVSFAMAWKAKLLYPVWDQELRTDCSGHLTDFNTIQKLKLLLSLEWAKC